MKNEEKYQKLLFLSELKETDLDAYYKVHQDKKVEIEEKEILPGEGADETAPESVVKSKKRKKTAIVAGILVFILAAGIVGGNNLECIFEEIWKPRTTCMQSQFVDPSRRRWT